MNARCRPSNKDRRNYYDKGITVYEDWKTSFESFYEHIGPRPSKLHSIDRIDNSKGYLPGNVRWATNSEQKRNSSQSKLTEEEVSWIRFSVKMYGSTQSDVANAFGISQATVSKIINNIIW